MKPIIDTQDLRAIRHFALVLALGTVAGCAIPHAKPDSTAQPAVPANAPAPKPEPIVRLAEDSTNRYLRLEAASTGLVNVADDGQTTFAVFAKELADIKVFDQDGKPVRHVRLRQLVAIEGRHAGLLLRTTYGASFAAPNPRAPNTPLPSLTGDPEVAEARTLLEAQGAQRANFDRALALADKPPTSAKPIADAPKPAPIVVATSAPPAPSDDTYLRQAGGVLMRVFFASGGRSVVRPDDGLMRLVREAQGAQQIRITGYTDSLGTAAANTVLAQQRAEAIRQHLVRNGVAPERILLGWTGATDYLAENTTEKGRAMNRRVEVQMISPSLAERR